MKTKYTRCQCAMAQAHMRTHARTHASTRFMYEVIEYIRNVRDEGGRVLIHCNQVAATLRLKYNRSLTVHLKLNANDGATPNLTPTLTSFKQGVSRSCSFAIAYLMWEQVTLVCLPSVRPSFSSLARCSSPESNCVESPTACHYVSLSVASPRVNYC